jgi:hypothetical protein
MEDEVEKVLGTRKQRRELRALLAERIRRTRNGVIIDKCRVDEEWTTAVQRQKINVIFEYTVLKS